MPSYGTLPHSETPVPGILPVWDSRGGLKGVVSDDLRFVQGSAASILGRYYPGGYGTVLGTNALTFNTIYAAPLFVPLGGVINRIVFEVTTAGGAGSVARVGLYAALSKSDIAPGRLVVDGGEVVTSGATGVKVATLSNIRLEPGLYWTSYLCGVAAPTVRVLGATGATQVFNPILGFDVGATITVAPSRVDAIQAYGPLPDPWPVGGIAFSFAVVPLVAVRFASIGP
jgi:hypothetical protein